MPNVLHSAILLTTDHRVLHTYFMITGSLTLQFRDLIHAYLANRLNYLPIILGAAGYGLILAFREFKRGSPENIPYAFILPVFIASCCLAVFMCLLLLWQFKKLQMEQKTGEWNINEQDLSIKDASGSSAVIPWAQLTSVKTSKQGYLLARKGCGPLWIPSRTFNKDMKDKFEALVAAKFGE